jgi:DNA mismatch repair protein MutL
MANGESPKRIQRLPDNLVNKIAAGEVIERPASIVKELLENSIDASATNITVEIKNGGRRMIRMHDNGHGIHSDDLMLAVDRHTTSKLDSESDLSRVSTLGFRGEALSSIAAVSCITLTSRQKATDHGWSIMLSAHVTSPKILPAAHPVGTTVEVMDLFQNIPARRKFLRSEKTEFIHIQELVKRIALSRFNLSLRLVHNDREIFHVAGDRLDPSYRVLKVLGRRFLDHALHINQRAGDMALYGWIGLPDIARSQSDQQYFYLNGRVIRDKLMSHALRLAYQELLYPGRYPACLLYLEMDLTAVDINVHPTKHEVRFRDARSVHDFIYSTINSSLNNHLHNAKHRSEENTHNVKSAGVNDPPDNGHLSYIGEPGSNYRNVINLVKTDPHNINTGIPVSLLQGRFLIFESDNKTFLMNIYRVRELIVYDKFKITFNSGNIISRPVLVPLVLKLNKLDIEFVNQHQNTLEHAGILVSQISHDTLQIRAIPQLLTYTDAVSLVHDTIDFLKTAKKPNSDMNGILYILAKHINDCAPARLSLTEMNTLIKDFCAIQKQLAEKIKAEVVCALDEQILERLLSGRSW